ncbi:MAG: 2-oxo acid dehydrogenase subunit E2, partial [Mycobacteriales bacterium]
MATTTDSSHDSNPFGSASSAATIAAEFGANEWIVDEMYQQYLEDPNSVDAAWHEFFADYKPGGDQTTGKPTSAPSQPVAPIGVSAPQPTAANASQAIAITTAEATTRTATTTKPAPDQVQASKPPTPPTVHDSTVTPIRGAAARIVTNMDASLTVPTATSVRAVPAKLMADNRIVLNNHLKRGRGGKVSFTHLIGYALVKALAAHPEMNQSFTVNDGKPALVIPEHVNVGLAIDLVTGKSRSLVVAAIKATEKMDFAQFVAAYEELIRKARSGKLTADDFVGTTISLTNPGTIGTNHSVPRLMAGQGTIVGVGAMEYPAEFSGMN